MRAFVFPGQGSQYCGMGRDVAETFAEAREIFERADEALGFPLSRLCFQDPGKELQLTENTQPAVLTTSVAFFRVLQKRGARPDFVAGHSLGEYSAVVAAGGLEFDEAVRLVRQRGRFMQEAVPRGEGAMTAIIGLPLTELEQICREASQEEVVSPANINSSDQIVLAGHLGAVERAGHLAKKRGARKVIPLQVSAPFHCQLMKPAEKRLAEIIRQVAFSDLSIPLINNVGAQKVTIAEDVRIGLLKQVSSAVLWNDCVQRLLALGVSTFVEVGPGKVLAGLIRRIAPSAEVINAETAEQLKAYV